MKAVALLHRNGTLLKLSSNAVQKKMTGSDNAKQRFSM
jgi:hypothetical protein